MKTSYEIISKFEAEGDANGLLYTPRANGAKARKTSVYEVEFEGDEAALNQFVREVMFDPIAQTLLQDSNPAFADSAFILDVTMKGGALDHEREAILDHHRHFPDQAFEIKKLRIFRRYYLFGDDVSSEPFIRDLVNPAVQQYRLLSSHVS